MIFILIISIVLLIFSLARPKSQLLTLVFFVFMWFIMGWNTGNADYEMYQIRFDRFDFLSDLLISGISDPGFSIIILFFRSLGFDFIGFKIILSILSLSLIYSTIRKYSIYPAFVSACYFLFLFALDVTQFRNFIAYSIVLYAVRFLFQDGKRGVYLYSLLILLASTIHSSSLFYFLFLFARKKINIQYILLILIAIIPLKSILLSLYSSSLETDKLSDQYSQGVSAVALVSIVIVQMANAIYLNLFKKYPIENTLLSPESEKSKQKYDGILTFSDSNIIPAINLFMLFLIPFFADNIIYSRIFRNIIVLNFIFLSNHNLNNIFKSLKINYLIILLYGFYFYYFYFIFSNGWDVTIQPLLINNSIFN